MNRELVVEKRVEITVDHMEVWNALTDGEMVLANLKKLLEQE